jgi:diphthine-ammonia ligase
VRRVKQNSRVSSSHFDRTDVEVVVHSDNGFASVSYLRIKGATLEKKSDLRGDLIIPPLLEADFSRIQTLMRGHQSHHSTDTPIHAVSEPVTGRPTAPPRGPSHSRRGNWVAVGNVHCVTNQATTFEEEVVQCFRKLQGSFTSIGKMSL